MSCTTFKAKVRRKRPGCVSPKGHCGQRAREAYMNQPGDVCPFGGASMRNSWIQSVPAPYKDQDRRTRKMHGISQSTVWNMHPPEESAVSSGEAILIINIKSRAPPPTTHFKECSLSSWRSIKCEAAPSSERLAGVINMANQLAVLQLMMKRLGSSGIGLSQFSTVWQRATTLRRLKEQKGKAPVPQTMNPSHASIVILVSEHPNAMVRVAPIPHMPQGANVTHINSLDIIILQGGAGLEHNFDWS
ncbi:hypothetical protein CIRG_04641 [Coccidioides immitis RMSCC 2394]|uniref:Uncharacterized protein n=1 Tax=Coccidioides immitis RMSCC 2394 TaxID=404692 RepID=A0A0J6YB43_COCIT|nr:hypothetical protein CIRG_04641 [Coccidioides immitis RMSCC 2394]